MFGKRVKIPRMRMTPPEKVVQKLCGMSIRSVEALRRSVNTITDTESEAMIVNAFAFLGLVPSVPDAPITIGRSGSTQGARIVSTPAATESKKKVIVLVVT